MFTRIVKMEFNKEEIPTFLINFEKIKEKIRAFEGCTFLELYQDKNNTDIFFTYSRWDTSSDLENYRSFKDNNIIIFENDTNNPLEYIENVYKNNLINENKRVIVYAPAHLFTKKENIGSHKEVCEYFLSKK